MNAAVRMHPLFPKNGTAQEQESFIHQCIDRLTRIRTQNEKEKLTKFERVSTKRMSGPAKEFVPQIQKVCQALNLNNTPCKFKATCGHFCKKHKVSAKDLELVV